MRIHLATDHAGLDFLGQIAAHLRDRGHEVFDHGPSEYDAADDYPGFCITAALAVVSDHAEGLDALGIVLGGSGNGEQIAANKVPGVRAALIWNAETAELARSHNNANVCALGARQHSVEEALELVDIFIATPFSEEPRHVRRIHQIRHFEVTGEIPESGEVYH